jgi:hypothetical protein
VAASLIIYQICTKFSFSTTPYGIGHYTVQGKDAKRHVFLMDFQLVGHPREPGPWEEGTSIDGSLSELRCGGVDSDRLNSVISSLIE